MSPEFYPYLSCWHSSLKINKYINLWLWNANKLETVGLKCLTVLEPLMACLKEQESAAKLYWNVFLLLTETQVTSNVSTGISAPSPLHERDVWVEVCCTWHESSSWRNHSCLLWRQLLWSPRQWTLAPFNYNIWKWCSISTANIYLATWF